MKVTARNQSSRSGVPEGTPRHCLFHWIRGIAALLFLCCAAQVALGDRPDPPEDPEDMRAAINVQGESSLEGTLKIVASQAQHGGASRLLFSVEVRIPVGTTRADALLKIRDALNADPAFTGCDFQAVVQDDQVKILAVPRPDGPVPPTIDKFSAIKGTQFFRDSPETGQVFIFRFRNQHPAEFNGIARGDEVADIKIDKKSDRGAFVVTAYAENGKRLFDTRVRLDPGLTPEATAQEFVNVLSDDPWCARNYSVGLDPRDRTRVVLTARADNTPRIGKFKSKPGNQLPFTDPTGRRAVDLHRQTATWSAVRAGGDAGDALLNLTETPERPDPTPPVEDEASAAWTGGGTVALERIAPSLCRGAASLCFSVPSASPVTLRVFDASGRLVRTLLGGTAMTAGEHRVQWDTRDDQGRPVMEGVYYCQLSAMGARSQQRVMVLR
jgi:hypothetical protein